MLWCYRAYYGGHANKLLTFRVNYRKTIINKLISEPEIN